MSHKPMSDKPIPDTFGSAEYAARHSRSRPAALRQRLRATLVAIAAGAITLSAVVDGYAQRGTGAGRMGGGGINMPVTGTRGPVGDIPRNPGGGGGPRFPGGGGGAIMIPPGGYGPGGRGPVVVYEDDDDAPVRRRAKRAGKKQKQQLPKQNQIAGRSGFNPPPPGEQRFVRNEVLLNVAPGTSAPALDAIARRHRLTRLDLQSFAMTRRSLARVRINDGRPVATVIRSLQADARILGAQPNYLYALQQGAAPPPAAGPAQYSLAKMHLPEVHAITTGSSVLIAVIDSMIDARHPDLQGVVASAFDATGNPGKPHNHGTGIAGVIAAHGKLTGVAPAVKILAVHAFPAAKAFPMARSEGNSMNILKGLDWSGKQNANIINMSFTGAPDEEVHVMLKELRARGTVLIAAAGNAGPQSRPLYPAAFPEVIAVTATDIDDKLFKMANRGTHIAVAAPGVDVLAAAPDGGYQMTTGTSFAAAQVSGVAALILDRNRKLDAAAVRRILMATARDLGPHGHDDQFGSGLVDALGAVMQATPASSDVSGSAPAAAK